MKRRKAREYVLQYLFQTEFRDANHRNNLKQFWSGQKETAEIRKFANEIIDGTLAEIKEIDGVIKGVAEHWATDRMAAVDRNILRFAVYELLYRKDIPPAVTINEAIEIAKKYSTTESASFINGILDKISKTVKKKEKVPE